MKVAIIFEYIEILNQWAIRWDSILEKEDIENGITVEQMKAEIGLCVNNQLRGKTIW